MKARVLVADDEPAMAEVMCRALEASDYEVLTAHDGAHALEIARREKPDLAFLDVMMPRIDGREVCRRIQGDPELSHMPVVLFGSMDEQDVDWRAAGAREYLQKAFDVLSLPDVVERILAEPAAE